MLYRSILKPILFRFDPEVVHDYFISFGEKLALHRATYALVNLIYGYHKDNAVTVVDGLSYRTPVILSAGFDYNARLTEILPAVSFGGVEVGSVTARPCEGNKMPRMTRLPKSRSIIVNKGLRNDGVDKVIERLKTKKKIKDFVVGVSIARTNDSQTVTTEEGIEDYFTSFKKLNQSDTGDYYTINISCPNAFGGETFAEPNKLEMLLETLMTVECQKPVYIKMPINLEWIAFDELLQVIEKYKIAGVVIGNLNKDYKSLNATEGNLGDYRGGLSGWPCFELSNNLIRKTREKYGKRFTIMGTGGIFSPKDAMDKIKAGADLVQIITGMIYEGPSLIKKIANEYAGS